MTTSEETKTIELADSAWREEPISMTQEQKFFFDLRGWISLPAVLTSEEIEEMRASLAGQIETLDRNLEYRLQANHLLSNLIAMVFGGLLMAGPRADRWLARIRGCGNCHPC